MPIKDWIRSLMGTATEHEAKQPADPDDLIALSRVSTAMETELGYEPAYEAGLVFSDISSIDFEKSLEEVKGVIHHQDQTENADLEMKDVHGNQWIVVQDSSVESLFANLQYGASAMESVEYDSRLLAAVAPFEKGDRTAYVVYSFKRGKFYPFVPTTTNERDRPEENRIEALLREEIDVEEDVQYWYPLWPPSKDLHPWETIGDN